MSIENLLMAVAFVVILGTAGYYLRRAVRVLRRTRRVKPAAIRSRLSQNDAAKSSGRTT
jgi:hypothetical protein